MPSQTASRDNTAAATRYASSRTGRARTLAQGAVPAPRGRRRQPNAATPSSGGVLPSYCDRKPAAMLDDGWMGETLNHADELETIESGDDFLIDFGDLEDSR